MWSDQLTIRKCQNTDDKKEGDDQDEPHPHITVSISIVSADRMKKNNKNRETLLNKFTTLNYDLRLRLLNELKTHSCNIFEEISS